MFWFNNLFPLWATGPFKRRDYRRMAEYENYLEFQETYAYMLQVVLNMFEWKNLPDTCNARALEMNLTFDGKCVFFNDTKRGYLNLPVTLSGNQNLYHEHIKREAYGGEDFRKTLTIDNSVLIRNNDFMHPSAFFIELMAKRIADSYRTLDVYSSNMKHPFIIFGDEGSKPSVENLVNERNDNVGLIVLRKEVFSSSERDARSQLDINAPPEGLKVLWDHKRNMENDFLTRYGIDNANTDKRERLITDEVESNNQLLKVNIDLMFDKRKDACTEINQKFGLNVGVELKSDALEQAGGILEDVPRGTGGAAN